MKTIRIAEDVKSKVIEDEDRHYVKEEETTKVEDVTPVVSEEETFIPSYESLAWPSKYHYMLYCIIYGSGGEVLPMAVRYCLALSGTAVVLIVGVFSMSVVLPMIYLEVFLGQFVQKTNGQMYKMAPIFFGLSVYFWLYNIVYTIVDVMEESTIVTHYAWKITSPATILNCSEGDLDCYDFSEKGPINDTCENEFISMKCENLGIIRYDTEYKYWMLYKSEKDYANWQLVLGALFVWLAVALALTRGLYLCSRMMNFGFIIHMSTFTLMAIMGLPMDGGWKGLTSISMARIKGHLSFHDVLGLLTYSLFRTGIIFPTGHMTYSSKVPPRKGLAAECSTIMVLSLLLTAYYIITLYIMMGVLREAIGVDMDVLFVPYRGMYLAMVPAFLKYIKCRAVFVNFYYFSLLFLEIIKLAIRMHMWILNLYDYVPRFKQHHTYVSIVICGLFYVFSTAVADPGVHMSWIPDFYAYNSTCYMAIHLAFQMTMVVYVYGISRVSEDIQFLAGHEPNKLFRFVWFWSPLAFYVCFGIINSKDRKLLIQKDTPGYYGEYTETSTLHYVNYTFMCLIVLFTIPYIFNKMGSDNMIWNLFKPDFFWGPPDREQRKRRKQFTPKIAIRSLPVRLRGFIAKKGQKFETGIEKDQMEKSKIFSDTKFFSNIGVPPDKIKKMAQTFEAVKE